MEQINGEFNDVPGRTAYGSTDLFDIITQHGDNMVIAANRSLQIVMLNNAAQQGFGISEQQGLQKHLLDLISVGGRSIANDIDLVLKGKSRLQAFRLTDMGRHFEWKVYPLQDQQKNIAGVVCLVRDISSAINDERKIAELHSVLLNKQLLLHNRALMAETILDASDDLIMVVDRDLSLCAANKALLKGCGKLQDDLRGKKLFDCFPGLRDSGLHFKLIAALKGTASSIQKMGNWVRDRLFDVSLTPLSFNERVYGALIIARDITAHASQMEEMDSLHRQIRKMSEELNGKNKLIQSLLSGKTDSTDSTGRR